MDVGEDNGQSRLDGFFAALPSDHHYTIHHVQSNWPQEDATHKLTAYLDAHADLQVNAIFGLSDMIAIAACDVARSRGRIDNDTLILGINGDPLALASIADGRMMATVEADIDDLATQVVDLAYHAACDDPLPPFFRNRQRLVTIDNVAEVATRKLLSLATLPTRLVEVNRRNAQERIIQRATSVAIDRQVGLILDEQELSLAITALIRDSYGFDNARFLVWNQHDARLIEIGAVRRASKGANMGIAPSGSLEYALTHNQMVFIPDTDRSSRFAPDPLWPEMHARVVVPVHLGGRIVGLLDLHRREVAHYSREELDGLELLADRLGISIRNAELYGEALDARSIAEKADRLKTVLLTNVSHELRTPLNVILGYGQTTLDTLNRPGAPNNAQLSQYVTHIYTSAEHLLRLINDLLDFSRAEIDELDLLPETLNMRSFLQAVFEASTMRFSADSSVAWRLDLPPELPSLTADPVRLRQVLLNLLHNAHKFTQRGQIILGAEVVPPDLHLWVADTGIGIPGELQEHIFDPFISIDTGVQRHEGIGLGLSIARRLVALHRGRMAVESAPGQGSTFHIYLPLPAPATMSPALNNGHQRALVLITETTLPPMSVVALAEQRGLTLHLLRPTDDLTEVLAKIQPALLVWSLATALEHAWSIVEQIRARANLPEIPVMLYQGGLDTAFSAPGTLTGLLLKPLGESVLIEALEQLASHATEGCILIVEDDPQLRALHRRIIAEHFPNYTIRDVGDGRAALDILAGETPSLIVLDLMMPEVDGFAVLEALRANSRTAVVPVLVLSGKILSADDVRRLAEARVIYQTKDILAEDDLAEVLRRTLAREERLPPHTSALVKRAIAFIQQHHDEPLSRQEIADTIGVSKDYLGRIFQQELGLSPWEYLIRYRVLRAKELLRTTSYSVAEVATRVGFDTTTYFSHIFHREVGCSPRAFRAQITS
jgi:signal transduction histidine kinase/AraC-like DNA-binding protein